MWVIKDSNHSHFHQTFRLGGLRWIRRSSGGIWLNLQPSILLDSLRHLCQQARPLRIICIRIVLFLVPSRAQWSAAKRNDETQHQSDETTSGVTSRTDEAMSRSTKRSDTVTERNDETTSRSTKWRVEVTEQDDKTTSRTTKQLVEHFVHNLASYIFNSATEVCYFM